MKTDSRTKPSGAADIGEGSGGTKQRFLRKHVVVHHCTRCGCDKSPLVNVVKGDKKSSYVCRWKNRCRRRQTRRWRRG